MVKIIYIFILLTLMFTGCKKEMYEEIKETSSKELIDQKQNKFLLNKDNLTIYCFDNNNNFLWKKTISTEYYRFKNPKIEIFELGKNSRVNHKETLFISLDNSIFGYVDLENGNFVELGRD